MWGLICQGIGVVLTRLCVCEREGLPSSTKNQQNKCFCVYLICGFSSILTHSVLQQWDLTHALDVCWSVLYMQVFFSLSLSMCVFLSLMLQHFTQWLKKCESKRQVQGRHTYRGIHILQCMLPFSNVLVTHRKKHYRLQQCVERRMFYLTLISAFWRGSDTQP